MQENLSDKLNQIQANINFVPFQDLKILFQQPKKFKCINNNLAIHVCSEKQCQLPGFICGQYQCKCQELHFKCKTILFRRVIKSITQKSKQTPKQVKELYKILYQKINKMIDDLSDLRTKFENEQENFGLHKQDLKFVELIRDVKYDKICGKIINEMQNTMQTQIQFSMCTKQEIIQNFKKQRQIFEKMCSSIENKYSKKDKNKFHFEKYIYLDIGSKKISFQYQASKQKIEENNFYKFVPIKMNQSIGQFQKGFFKILDPNNSNICQKIQDNNWKQIVSIQQLPQQGKYFFEINIYKAMDNNHVMIGIVTQQLRETSLSFNDNKSIYYYASNGTKCPGCNPTIGRTLKNNQGLMSVLINMDEKEIHWCIDRQYQGKHAIPQYLLNKKLYASFEALSIGTKFQFINTLQS